MVKKWKFRGGGRAYVKFPPWWGYGYFLELHIYEKGLCLVMILLTNGFGSSFEIA